MSRIKKTVKKTFPLESKAGKALKKVAVKAGMAKSFQYDQNFQDWIRYSEPATFLAPIKGYQKKDSPLFSIVIPFFNTADKYLEPLMDSIINQSFQDWELIMADASTDIGISESLKEQFGRDNRIVYKSIPDNKGISANTNHALECARGKFIVFVDHDDTLSTHALNEVAAILQKESDIDIFYSDEDKITDDGRWRHSVFFKPDWSPHLFLHTNYTNHLSVIRRDLVNKVGGLRPEFDGAQDYDLLLRIHALPQDIKVHHISKILYHWREAGGSTAANFDHKAYAFEAGRKALQQYMESQKLLGEVKTIAGKPGFYNFRLNPKKNTKALILIVASQDVLLNNLILQQLESHTHSQYISPVYKEAYSSKDAIQAIQSTSPDAVIFVSGAVLPQQTNWLDELCGVLSMKSVLATGPRVISSKHRIVDEGIVKSGESYIDLLKGCKANAMTINGHAEWVHDVDAPSMRLFAISASRAKDVVDVVMAGKKDDFCDQLSDLSKKHSQFCVTWSHATFIPSGAQTSKSGFFNANLQISKKNNIIPKL